MRANVASFRTYGPSRGAQLSSISQAALSRSYSLLECWTHRLDVGRAAALRGQREDKLAPRLTHDLREEGDVVQVHIHAEDAVDLHQVHLRRNAWSRRCDDDTATILLRAGATTSTRMRVTIVMTLTT